MKKLLCFAFLAGALLSCTKDDPEDIFVPYQWSTASPQSAGFDTEKLDSAFLFAAERDYIDGVLVIRHGSIVAEKYFNHYDKDYPHNVMSVSKSMLSAITGVAIEKGYIESIEEKVLDYFPEYQSSNVDERLNELKIKHLLTMRMGIDRESTDNYRVYSELYNSDNWVRSTLESDLLFSPGEKMYYNTFITHLLSAIIAKATGMSTAKFAEKYVFNPMGIDVDQWEQDPQGIYFGGNTMHFTPREMAVLGYVYLNDGKLDGRQIIPEEWVEATLEPSTSATHPNEWGAWKNYNYAWLWWLGQFNEKDVFMGYGYGGQFVMVFEELDLIIVATANNNVPPEATDEQEWAIFEIVAEYILPAVE